MCERGRGREICTTCTCISVLCVVVIDAVIFLASSRAKHGVTNHIPENFIPTFFDLVVWGHEHECRLQPEYCAGSGGDLEGEEEGVFISQPGSSVATSLCEGETKKK